MRLDRYLTSVGIGTRRNVKSLIKEKRVTVNGVVSPSGSQIIDEYKDEICFDGEKLTYHLFYYCLLNKPAGYVSATKPEGKYPPVTDLVEEYAFAGLFPVGRLDQDSTGLLLLTNNGTLAHRLLSPKYHVDKVYQVEVDFPLKEELIEAFKNGIYLDDELTLPATLRIIDELHGEVILHEGKFHQVKRMFAHFGYKVLSLHRSRFAFLEDSALPIGSYRLLQDSEILALEEYQSNKK